MLKGKQFERLHKALMDAYTSRSALERLVQFSLSRSLNEIAGSGNLEDVVYELLQWATAHGKIDALLDGAIERNPDNPTLAAAVQKYRAASDKKATSPGQNGTSDNETSPTNGATATTHIANPFMWRGGITEADAFFNRDREQNRLYDALQKRQNTQIVGERRIGKTSLLLHIERTIPTKMPDALIAFMDMTHPTCYTLNGFLRRAGQAFHCAPLPDSLTAFAEQIEALCRNGKKLVLCLDEFEECTLRRDEFCRDFFLTLRACSQGGMAIITASCQPLNRLTDPRDPTSPFYNTFQLLSLLPFSEEDAMDFLTVPRSGVPAFSPEEKTRILEFARRWPLALQVACSYVVEAKERHDTLSLALQRANDEMRALLPSW